MLKIDHTIYQVILIILGKKNVPKDPFQIILADQNDEPGCEGRVTQLIWST